MFVSALVIGAASALGCALGTLGSYFMYVKPRMDAEIIRAARRAALLYGPQNGHQHRSST
jgi:hypothetical protein